MGAKMSPEEKLWAALLMQGLRERPRPVNQLFKELKEGGFPEAVINKVVWGKEEIGIGGITFEKDKLCQIFFQHFIEKVSRVSKSDRERYLNKILEDLDNWMKEASETDD